MPYHLLNEKGPQSQGTFLLAINGEGTGLTEARVFFARSDIFDRQGVDFSSPEEASVIRTVWFNVPIVTSGVFEILPDEEGLAMGHYAYIRKGEAGGTRIDTYTAHKGRVEIDSADEATGHMKGKFKFQVDVEGLVQSVEGEFDLSN
jgi:hypothetical protein